ncbi:MAG: hypothetical protein K9G70_14305 [Prolixibacteraceae bacterium]|nr:hypothetical protein [Prolixibacteraceae bacterium]
MKKLLLFTIATAILFLLQSLKKEEPIQNCESFNSSYLVNNFHAYGDQLLNFTECYFISDMATRGYTINLSFKADKYCKYSWSKTFTDSDPDFYGETFDNVQEPNTSDYTTTIKIESGCVYDYYMGLNVKFVWKKSIKSTDHGASAELGFPQKEICAQQLGINHTYDPRDSTVIVPVLSQT